MFVVWRDPTESRTREPDRVATCVPLAFETPRIANLALVVDSPPTEKSYVELIGERRLLVSWK